MADREAFDAYVRERWVPLLRTAILLTGDRHAAEDLVQETLVRAAQHWSRVEPADGRRLRARASSTPARSTPGGGAGTSRTRSTRAEPRRGPAPGDARMPSTTRLTLAAALARLTPRQRAVLVARFYEDRTEVETAAGARLLGEHREVADPPRPGAAAGARARARRHLRPRGDRPMSPDPLGTALRDLVDDVEPDAGPARRRRRSGPPAAGVASARWPPRPSRRPASLALVAAHPVAGPVVPRAIGARRARSTTAARRG